jgi:hypothetical protein
VPWSEVFTVIFLMNGTRISGCVFKQNDTIDTQMKNTDITPTICEVYVTIIQINTITTLMTISNINTYNQMKLLTAHIVLYSEKIAFVCVYMCVNGGV